MILDVLSIICLFDIKKSTLGCLITPLTEPLVSVAAYLAIYLITFFSKTLGLLLIIIITLIFIDIDNFIKKLRIN